MSCGATGSSMSSAAPSRWTDGSMHKRLRRRYVTERWFRFAGLGAISLSVLFLAFLLYTMSAKGLGGFFHHEAALPIDASKTDLFLDPATLRGPDAEQSVLSADLAGAISSSAVAAYGSSAENMFSDAAVSDLARDILKNPDMLLRPTTLWLPVGSKVDVAAKDAGDPETERL